MRGTRAPAPPLSSVAGVLQWVEDAWRAGLEGGYLPFEDADADALIDWLNTQPPGFYARAKLAKVWRDSRDLRSRALEEAWRDPVMSGVTVQVEKVKQLVGNEGAALLQGGTTLHRLGRVSGTIDWLHTGIALRHDYKVWTDDAGAEVPMDRRLTTQALKTQLGLGGG